MTIRIGVVGLGGIAQKAWLPVLSQARAWQLVGAFSPNQANAQVVCERYRIPCFSTLNALAAACDAVFVHTSTASHYEVVHALLQAGKDVCVDKPLAETLNQAEALVTLAEKKQRRLMVAFNRRFAPAYQQLKDEMASVASLRVEKHRSDSVGPQDLRFTLLDDYLHVVDTALWLAGGRSLPRQGHISTNEQGQMLYAEHHFNAGQLQVTTSMHRRAGSQRERVSAIGDGQCIDIHDMRDSQVERGAGVVITPSPSWQSHLAQRGFVGAAEHFIQCVENQTKPETSGEQALLAQRVVESMWRDAERE
ncbi:virulence factor MviM [Pantoea ananatis]|jgi:virulence factor|uniref:Oxidoreductase YceM n=1 Tax=Pantoea ananas TaxID=553 RepID=A0AAJ1D2A6_PANAN|nr:Gfo/Idh/MocA family oxidoreductase [Pantoea ananatis]AWQ19272.1 gfo/Idh/MocA family oxidoreductase [Pantoea ananatis]KTR46709.1 virulence factor MviM [Pantoea ananatis]KTR54799.1 virulence factor MviM [Pantoea ananatis]KTR65304.1 virulence factor MviM [Pantoea ananatis]KTR68902.1 virulence factor MviM [Pantoea ananatis]